MASFELPEPAEARLSPQMLVGVASPLWGYFGAAAAGGIAYWWMTRWTRPMNLEALFGARVAPTMDALLEPMAEAAEAAAETADQVLESASDALPPLPVGGEAAPISPLIETAAPEPPAPEPAAPEPAALEAALEATAEAPPEPSFEATADPLPEPAAKPRVRRPPTANGLEA